MLRPLMVTIYAQLKIIPPSRKHREYVISFLSEFESGDPLPGLVVCISVSCLRVRSIITQDKASLDIVPSSVSVITRFIV